MDFQNFNRIILFYGSLESKYDGMFLQRFFRIFLNDSNAFPPLDSNPLLAVEGLKVQRKG